MFKMSACRLPFQKWPARDYCDNHANSPGYRAGTSVSAGYYAFWSLLEGWGCVKIPLQRRNLLCQLPREFWEFRIQPNNKMHRIMVFGPFGWEFWDLENFANSEICEILIQHDDWWWWSSVIISNSNVRVGQTSVGVSPDPNGSTQIAANWEFPRE